MYQVGESGIVQLHRRHVHRDSERTRPCGSFGAGGAQYPFADVQDGTTLLRNGNEYGGRDITARGVLPAQQCFKPNDLTRLKVLLRLVDQSQFPARYGMAQIVLDMATVANLLAHLRLEKSVGPASVRLGAIQRRIGMTEQR